VTEDDSVLSHDRNRWSKKTVNGLQRMVLLLGVVIIAAMCAYPPWILESKGVGLPIGYSFVTKPPVHTGSSLSTPTLDRKRLIEQCALAGLASAALIWILRSRKKQPLESSSTHWRNK